MTTYTSGSVVGTTIWSMASSSTYNNCSQLTWKSGETWNSNTSKNPNSAFVSNKYWYRDCSVERTYDHVYCRMGNTRGNGGSYDAGVVGIACYYVGYSHSAHSGHSDSQMLQILGRPDWWGTNYTKNGVPAATGMILIR